MADGLVVSIGATAARGVLCALADRLLLLLAAGLAVLPVAYLLYSGFNVAELGAPYRFGTDHWAAVVEARSTVRSALTSLVLSLRVAVGFVIALGISWAIVRIQVFGRRFIEVSLWFAFFLPMTPVALAWIVLLHKDYGLVNFLIGHIPFAPKHFFSVHSIGGIMWIYLTVGTVPFLTIIFAPVLRQIDVAFEEAGRVNGATRWQTLRRISMPLLLPGLIAGLMAMFIRSLESFEVEQLVGTPAKIFVFTTSIYDMLRQEPPEFGRAMAFGSLFLVVALVLSLAQAIYAKRHPAVATVRAQSFRTGMASGSGLRIGVSLIVIGYIVIAIYLPVAVILVGSCNKIFGLLQMADPWTLDHWREVAGDGRFLLALRNSLLFGLGISALVLPVYFRLAWILARGNVAGRAIVGAVIWLPWAVPGFVFGLAVLDALLRLDFLAIFYGTALPVLVILLVKEMPVGVHLLKVAIEQNARELEEVAASSGAGAWDTFRRVTLPLLSPTVVGVFIIVFTAVIKEVSAIVLVSAPGTETLSILMFDYATTGRTESAAVIGVVFAITAMVMALVVNSRLVPMATR